MKNPNLNVAEIFVSELVRAGIREVCLAPGSRSTPLALAFSAHPNIQIYVHLDERCAAFFALGLAAALDRPVPVLCTSGSAAANFFPAIIEARMSRIPLLLLTADRPPELRESGANQTIDQVKLYGDQVLWSVDLPVPEAHLPELTLRHVRTLAARAVGRANGIEKGPVHLNFPFRKPLEPTSDQEAPAWEPLSVPLTRMERGLTMPTGAQVSFLSELLKQNPLGLIVCGPGCPGMDFPEKVHALSESCGYPLLADPLSGCRFGFQKVIGGYDGFLAGGRLFEPEPQVILRFGGVPTSASLTAYLSNIRPAHRIYISEHGGWADDDHRTSWYLQADPAGTCQKLLEGVFSPSATWRQQALQIEKEYWDYIGAALAEAPWFDGSALAEVLRHLPEKTRLFIGNSLAVRNLDRFGAPDDKVLEVYGNRGASGIDGNISTALGIAAADRSRPLVALVGDLTFYHDMNGLVSLRKQGLSNVTVVLFNNRGGGIFRRLPVARFGQSFEELFLTPHDLQFQHVASLYGMDYHLVTDTGALQTALSGSFTGRAPRLIEVVTDSERDLSIYNQLKL
jgi:2-succinyl-5-enolpyruvyl-6-hydroxy-3-cyclohexene-1-carboxylate synthase